MDGVLVGHVAGNPYGVGVSLAPQRDHCRIDHTVAYGAITSAQLYQGVACHAVFLEFLDQSVPLLGVHPNIKFRDAMAQYIGCPVATNNLKPTVGINNQTIAHAGDDNPVGAGLKNPCIAVIVAPAHKTRTDGGKVSHQRLRFNGDRPFAIDMECLEYSQSQPGGNCSPEFAAAVQIGFGNCFWGQDCFFRLRMSAHDQRLRDRFQAPGAVRQIINAHCTAKALCQHHHLFRGDIAALQQKP